MPKTLEQIISSHEILSQIFISCKSLPDEGKFGNALTELKEIVPEYRNVTKDHLITPKEETALEEKLLLVSARMIDAISKSQNGIVLNNNGEIDAERSLEQAQKNGKEVLPEVKYAASKEIIKELWSDRLENIPELKQGENVFEYAMRALSPGEDYSSILKLLASNYDREINEPRSFSISNDISKSYLDRKNLIDSMLDNNEELKDDETGEKTQIKKQIAYNQIIKEFFNSSEFAKLKSYRKSLTDSWLNDEPSVYLFNAIRLCIDAEEAKENGSSDLEKIEKARDNYLKKHPEFAEKLLGENGKVTEKSKETYFKYSYALTRTKIIDQMRKNASNEFLYSCEIPERKAEYLRISLLALGDYDENIKRIGIDRLSSIENEKKGFKLIHEVTGKDGKTSVLLDYNAFLDEYNKVAKTKYTNIQEFYNDSIKFQQEHTAGKTLKMLDKQASEGKFEKLDFTKQEQAIKRMEELRKRENEKEETITIKTYSDPEKTKKIFNVTKLEETKKIKMIRKEGTISRRDRPPVMRKNGIKIKNRKDIPQLKNEKSKQEKKPDQDNFISLVNDNEMEQTFGYNTFVKENFQDDEMIIANSNLGEINVDSEVLEQITTIMAETDTDKDNAVKMTEEELDDFMLKNAENLNFEYITLPPNYSKELLDNLDNFEYIPVDSEAISAYAEYTTPVDENEYTAEFAYSADSLEVSKIQADKNVFDSQNLSAENINEKDSSDEKTNENDENEKKSFLDKWKKRISLIGEKVKPIIANVMNTIKGTKYLGSGDGENPKPSENDVVLQNTLQGYIVTQDQLTPMTQVRAENMQKRSKEGQNLDVHDDHEEQAG